MDKGSDDLRSRLLDRTTATRSAAPGREGQPSPIFTVCATDSPVSIILKLVGEVCNLDCTYCYEKRKPYEGRRILRAAEIDAFLGGMPNPKFAIELHGGEPLLYPHEEFLALSRVLKAHDKRLTRITLQTNGTLLDKAMIRFLREAFPTLQVGISIDGPPNLEGFRVDLRGRNSAAAAAAGLSACNDECIDVGIICVVTQRSLGRANDLLRFFAAQPAVKVVKLVPCFDTNVRQQRGPFRRAETRATIEAAGDSRLPWAITPAEYSTFLEEAVALWISEIGPARFLLEPAVSSVRAVRGLASSNCHFGAHKCSHVFTLYPDKTVGACDELDRDAANYGTFHRANVLDVAQRLWGESMPEDIRQLLSACAVCEAAATCGGGCLATRRRLLAVGRAEEYCDHRKKLAGDAQRLLDMAGG